MLAVIYRGYIRPECEEEYQILWHQVAQYFIKHRGALGSCLHKAEDGQWVAYSRWPNKEMRDASWSQKNDVIHDFDTEIKEIIMRLKSCGFDDQPFEEICMDVIDDLL